MAVEFKDRPAGFFLTTDPHPLKEGLVFAGLGRFPGTTRFHDSSLYGNTGTLTNMDPATDWVPELGRWALDFDGSDDIVNTDRAPLLTFPFTISSWVKLTDSTADRAVITLGVDVSNYHYFRANATTRAVRMYSNTSFATGGTIADGGWSHVAGMVTSSTYRVAYVDGQPGTANTTSVDPGTITSGTIGARRRTTTLDTRWLGRLSDVLIYSRALSLSEIQQLADPSNVMLSVGGNPLLRYRRKWWPVSSGGAPTGKYWLWARQRQSQIIGGGL